MRRPKWHRCIRFSAAAALAACLNDFVFFGLFLEYSHYLLVCLTENGFFEESIQVINPEAIKVQVQVKVYVFVRGAY